MNLQDFIRKIVDIILRSRFPNITKEISGLGPSLVLDIICQSKLVERWVLQEEAFTDYEIRDSTELVILCQSLFSHIKQFTLLKEADSYSISSLDGQFLASDSTILNVGFHETANLKVYKFKSANTGSGTLFLSVVYDTFPESVKNTSAIEATDIPLENKKLQNLSPFPSPSLVRKMTRFSKKGLESQAPIPSFISNSSTVNKLENQLLGLNIAQKPNTELFGSFVGSYEQSLLSGRMSTFPSKPLWFSLEIGVIGTGNCKTKLKCPSHRTVSFPACYYEFENDIQQVTPYVGNVEISQNDRGYRIPFQGQLQIIIKNQKIPFKIFLIPYDLTDMPLDTKTYLRQKSYQTKELTPSINSVFSFSRTTSASDLQFNGNDILQHAIHLQIICTKQKRLYVQKSIRVVFSHRIPDQKLRVVNEVPMNPKFFQIDSPEHHGPSVKSKIKRSSFGMSRSEYKDTPLKQEYSASSVADDFSPCNTSEGR